MKKFTGFVIVLVVLAILVLGGYYAMGYKTEGAIKNTINNFNKVNDLYTEIKHYDRGWFTSNALVKWRVHVPERVIESNGQSQTVPPQDYTLETPLKIYHGPVIFSKDGVFFGLGYGRTEMQMPPEYAQQFSTLFSQKSDKPKLTMSLFVNYLQKSYMTLGVPEFTLYAKDGKGQFDWMGMTSTTSVSSKMDKIDGSFVIEGMKLAKDKTQIEMGEFNVDYDLNRHSTGLMLGKASMYLPSLMVEDNQTKIFVLDELSFSSESQIDDNLFNANMEASLKKLVTNGQIYGPGELKMSVKNLDAIVLAKINAEATEAQNGSDMQRQQALITLLPELPKLLNKGAEFEISTLRFTMPQGVIEGHLKVVLPKEENTNPFELLSKIKGNGKLTIPADVLRSMMIESEKVKMLKEPSTQQALIEQMQKHESESTPGATSPDQTSERDASAQDNQSTTGSGQTKLDVNQLAAAQTDQKLAQLRQAGLLARQGSDYVIVLHLEGGKLTVNDKPFSPGMINFN